METVLFLSNLDALKNFFFTCLIFGLRSAVLFSINVARMGILVLLLILEDNLSGFHSLVWCYLWVCHTYHYSVVVQSVNISRIFIVKKYWILSMIFCMFWDFLLLLSFILWMWCFRFIWVCFWNKSSWLVSNDSYNVLFN